MKRLAGTALLCLAMSACSDGRTDLDAAGRRACQEGFVAGAAQIAGRGDVEAYRLLRAYEQAAATRTRLLGDWRADHAELGTAEAKTKADADEAVRVLLVVCTTLDFVPVAPTQVPTPTPNRNAP